MQVTDVTRVSFILFGASPYNQFNLGAVLENDPHFKALKKVRVRDVAPFTAELLPGFCVFRHLEQFPQNKSGPARLSFASRNIFFTRAGNLQGEKLVFLPAASFLYHLSPVDLIIFPFTFCPNSKLPIL